MPPPQSYTRGGMPLINNAEEAKKLRDTLKRREHRRLDNWRKVRDMRMDDVLASLRNALPERLQEVFGAGSQTGEVEEIINERKHILVSNPVELEIVARSGDSHVLTLAQNLEKAEEAILDALFPEVIQLLECDSILGDGELVVAIDKLPRPDAMARYANRAALQQYAETVTEDQDEGSAEARYRRAYLDNDGDHDKAYAEVCDECEAEAGLRYRIRIVDLATFWRWRDAEGVRGIAIGMEHGRAPLAPVLQALSGYGMRREGEQIVMTREDQPTEHTAIGVPVMPVITEQSGQEEDAEMCDYTQIRTRDGIYVLVEHPRLVGLNGERGAGLISAPNYYGPQSCGYYHVGGIEKNRGNDEDRFLPPVIGLIVEAYELNLTRSAWRAMALAEATRDEYTANLAQPSVPPLERSQRPTNARAKAGQPQAVAGDIRRVESTGIKMNEYIESIERAFARLRGSEFFSGTGSSSEAGIHLARMQTAFLTKMQPYQKKRAELRKAVLEDIAYDVKNQQRPIFVPWMPDGERKDGEKIRVAKPMKITPEMAALPVVRRLTIGAESPETKYAREQASRAEVDFGTRSPLTHMEITGVKDPIAELKRIAKGGLLRDAIVGADGAPGWAITMFRQAIEARTKQWLDAKYPPPPASQIVGPDGAPISTEAFSASGPGQVPPGQARFTPAVQTDGGVPVAPGALPAQV